MMTSSKTAQLSHGSSKQSPFGKDFYPTDSLDERATTRLTIVTCRYVLLLFVGALLAAVPASLQAQTFQALPALSFTKVYQGGDPPSQVITAASTGAAFSFTYSGVNSSGGNWLSISPGSGTSSTPRSIIVSAHPDITLAPGTYSAQITLTSTLNQQIRVIPVSLIVAPLSAPSFDATAGAITFSLVTKGKTPPLQNVPIRNAGNGTLNWTASASTADGGNWLTLSATSGVAPSSLQVGINLANLPTAALSAGTFVGQVVLQSDSDRITIPVSVTVGASVFRQINPLAFTKAYQGGDPPSQVITAASTGADFSFTYNTINSTGGNWLTVSPGSGTSGTPRSITVSANPAITLDPGTYTAEIILTASDGTQASVVPVSLTVAPPTDAFFDETSGELTFSLVTKGNAPPLQDVPIRNGGSGTLNWTASASTADGGNWLTLSATSGVAPSSLEVGINPANLPTAALAAGTFVGQVVLQSDGDRITIPVTVTVGAAVFRQISPLAFTKAYQGGDPPSQVITAASTGANFSFTYDTINSTGGNWLSVSPGSGTSGTPRSITVSANPALTLDPGTYTAEIVLTATDGTQASVVPVTLTVAPPTAAFFDETSGELTFSLVTQGNTPPQQNVPIRNAGSGTLNWTASASTADGGNWLTLSATSGVAPSSLEVGINPANLPTAALSAGSFVGQVVLQSDTDRVTIPVTVTVGASVFRQINPLAFTKAYQGGNPPSQVITASSTGADFSFTYNTINSTGGNWLSVSPGSGTSGTPRSITVSANPAITLDPGTYTAEIVLTATDGTQASVVPVALTVAPPTAAFLDETPGALTFSMQPAGSAPPAQAIPIRNAGTGTLNWTANASTADGGNWLVLSATSGSAPGTLAASVDPAYLPNQGLSAGVFVGEIVLQGGTGSITVPVTFTVGASVFTPLAALSFSKPYEGSNPPTQTITAASTGASFSFNYNTVNSTGGNWLSISPGSGTSATPQAIVVSANPVVSLPAGTYVAEIILTASDGTQASVIPVSLTVGSTATPTATPTFSPGAGTYTAAQMISIADAAPGATIYYTTNGTTPSTSSAQYSGPFLISASETVKAVAISAGSTLSGVATATYSFTSPTVSSSSLAFGSQATNTSSPSQTVVITNSGANSLPAISLSLFGTNSADFALTANSCDAGIAAGGTCSFSVSFTPLAAGARSATVAMAYSGIGSPFSVGLTGTGVASKKTTTILLSPSSANPVYGQSVSVTAALSGSPSPGGTLSYTVDGGATQTVTLTAGSAVLPLGVLAAGSQAIAVNYAGDATYSSSSQSLTLTVAKAALTATAASYTRAYGQPNPTLAYTLAGFVNGDTASVVTGSATLSTTASSTSPAGTYPIVFATQTLAALNYAITYTSGTLTVSTASQTITFPAPGSLSYGGSVTLSATASSGLPVSYSISGPATLSGSTLTATGVGNVSITASQAGDANHSPAPSVTQMVTVTAATQTITFQGLPSTATYGVAGPYTLAATSTSGLAVAYSVSGPATLSGSVLTITGAGTVTVAASQAGNANYLAAKPVAQTIVVTAASQSITFTGLPTTATYGQAGPYTLNATATSGLPVSYTVTGPGALSGSILTVTGAGTVSVTASQAGNITYGAAPPLTQTIAVSRASQSITFTGLPATATYGAAGPYSLQASTNSGLAVTYSVSGPATLSGSTLTINGAGKVMVTASQAGTSNYAAAPPVTQTISVGPAAQTISFSGLPATAIYGSAGPYTLNGTVTSGLSVTYSVTGPATLSGNTLTILGSGTVEVTASQAGSANYSAATPVTQTILVSPAASGTILLTSVTSISSTSNGYQALITLRNAGTGTALNVKLTSATLGTTSSGTVPYAFADIPPGGSASATITFPLAAGAHGSTVIERLAATYTGGTLNASARAILP